MAGINFPSNPSVGQQYSEFGVVWTWNGSSWRKVSRTAVQGAQGNTGQSGSTGAQGATGPQGSQGLAGAQGSAGSTGAQGSAGSTGAQGSAGSTGAQGATGSSYSSSDDITTRNLKVTGITTYTGASVKFTGDSYDLTWNQSDDELEFKDNARL